MSKATLARPRQLEQHAVDWKCRRILTTGTDCFTTGELFVLLEAIPRHLLDAERDIIEYRFDRSLSLRIDRLRSALERVEDCLRGRFGLAA